jgi:DNA-directed RNA polymerase subunit beta
LKGRAQEGGQRVGEMEAWSLEAHGAYLNTMEMMGVKSDFIKGRRFLESSLIFGDREVELRNNWSESFNLLIQYLRGVGFDLKAYDYKDKEIDFYKSFSGQTKEKSK